MNAVFSSSSFAILIWWYPLYASQKKHLKSTSQRGLLPSVYFRANCDNGPPSLFQRPLTFPPLLGLPYFFSGLGPFSFAWTAVYFPSGYSVGVQPMFCGTPVISDGFQAKISKFCLSKEHSSLRPFSVNVDPMATVSSGLSGLVTNMSLHESDKECGGRTHFDPLSSLRSLSFMKQCSYKTSEDAPPSIYTLCTKCLPISTSMIIGLSAPSSSFRGGKDIAVSE
ncbi:hypothetical protein Tco_0991682 [Tanacetum coccineum]|uniref:Uncharacterized protein n=1 Tax=Tanacetum coccineum TaxID=301880 RepID=A0ABQ5F0Q2_9ASTR